MSLYLYINEVFFFSFWCNKVCFGRRRKRLRVWEDWSKAWSPLEVGEGEHSVCCLEGGSRSRALLCLRLSLWQLMGDGILTAPALMLWEPLSHKEIKVEMGSN